MRSADQIEQELDIARSDLESSLEQLKGAIEDKVDVKAHARRAIDRAKERATEIADRGMKQAAIVYCKAEAKVRARPDIVTGVLLGLVTVATLGIYLAVRVWRAHRRAARRPTWIPQQLTGDC